MRAVVFDCRDSRDPRWVGVTLRLFDDRGAMVLQGQVLEADPRGFAECLAARLQCPLTYVAAGAQILSEAPPAAKPSSPEPKASMATNKQDLPGQKLLF